MLPQQIMLRHDPDDVAGRVNNGKAADVVVQHEFGRLGDRRLRVNGHNPCSHEISDPHAHPPWSSGDDEVGRSTGGAVFARFSGAWIL
jgi:hypothetical protein